MIDRRTFLGSATSSTLLGVDGSRPAAWAGDGRPTFDVQLIGLDRWRVRSWEWSADSGAWRPVIGLVRRAAGGFKVEGRVAAGDEIVLAAWLKARQDS